MIKLSEKEKQAKNLFTYAIVMLLAVIIIIIIAAMADDREKEYQSKIDQTQETANSVQNEIMTLKDELYQLQQENETLNKTAESTQAYLAQFTALNQAWAQISAGDSDNARKILDNIDKTGFDDTLNAYYAALSELLTSDAK